MLERRRLRATGVRVVFLRIAVMMGLATLLGGTAIAANGDVSSISQALAGKEISDIAYDSSANPIGGSFWVLGRITGKVYHLSLDLNTVLGEVGNPHGVGSLPNFILSWGLAYRPASRSLFILAQDAGAWKAREVLVTDGSEVLTGAFEIVPPLAETASLRGLAFEAVSRTFWTLDANNDQLLQVDLSGAVVATIELPGRIAGQSVLRGDGVSIELEEVAPLDFQPRIYVSWGDLFRTKPSRILQLSMAGEPTGIEIPLDDLLLAGPLGFQTYRLGAQRRIAMVTASGQIASIEMTLPRPVPPSELTCTLSLANQVELTWRNNGVGLDREYAGGIRVLRNGVPFATITGTTSSFTDTTPLEGISDYALEGADLPSGPFSPASQDCTVTVGPGGLVRWVPFAGSQVYDVAHDPSTGDFFVTDNIGVDGQGRIYRYGPNLELVGEVPSPWTRPGHIAFVPMIQIQSVTLLDVLAVGRTDGLLVRIMQPDGTEKTTIPLDLGVSSPQLGGLTYVPQTQEFVVTELSEHKIAFLDQSGRFKRNCRPPDLFGLPHIEMGIAYDPIQDSILSIFRDGVVRELYSGGTCVPTGFEFGLETLGDSFATPGFFGGMAMDSNTLVIAGRQTNTLGQVLVFPFSPDFTRGDFDRNGAVNLTDAVLEARYLFQAGVQPACQDAADTNDDAVIDVSDPIYLLFYLFLNGPPPPAPYPQAGMDPTFRDNLGCAD